MAANNENRWTASEDDIIIAQWNIGLSALHIARTLIGRSRNAVIGRISRLRERGIDLKQTIKPPPPPLPRRKRRAPYAAKHRAAVMALAAPPPDRAGRNLLELGAADCRFIIDSDDVRSPTHLYCGADASMYDSDNCYCPYHQTKMRAR